VEVILILALGWAVLSWMRKAFGEPAEKEEAQIKEAALRRRRAEESENAAVRAPQAATSRRRAFDVYEDAVTESGRFDSSHEAFSSSRYPHKQASMVTGLTFEDDRIYVLRGEGVAIFPFGPSLTLAVVSGRTEGFKESTPFSMTLANEAQGGTARFPLEFPGWLEVVHQARLAGVVIELDASLPERLKEFIIEPTVDDGLPLIVIRSAEPAAPELRPSKCRACGASLGRKATCDFCGTPQ